MAKEFLTDDKRKIVRKSRWIQIHHDYVTKRHSLFDYADDYENPGVEGVLAWFRHKDRKYALGQFMKLTHPMFFEDENGKTNYLCGYDCTQYYKPYLIEIDDCGEAVRLYTEEE